MSQAQTLSRYCKCHLICCVFYFCSVSSASFCTLSLSRIYMLLCGARFSFCLWCSPYRIFRLRTRPRLSRTAEIKWLLFPLLQPLLGLAARTFLCYHDLEFGITVAVAAFWGKLTVCFFSSFWSSLWTTRLNTYTRAWHLTRRHPLSLLWVSFFEAV